MVSLKTKANKIDFMGKRMAELTAFFRDHRQFRFCTLIEVENLKNNYVSE